MSPDKLQKLENKIKKDIAESGCIDETLFKFIELKDKDALAIQWKEQALNDKDKKHQEYARRQLDKVLEKRMISQNEQ